MDIVNSVENVRFAPTQSFGLQFLSAERMLGTGRCPAVIPHNLIGRLSVLADAAVDDALLHGAPSFVRPPTTEPGYVAAVVRGAVPEIARAWAPILGAAKVRLSITGVYCHQSPRVRFPDHVRGTSTRELADLLLVHDNVARNGAKTRRAVLIQAKMIGGARDPAQLHLYTLWPTFEIRHQAFDHQRLRTFTTQPFLPCLEGGRYGLIDSTGAAPVWHCVVPGPAMAIGNTPALGTFFAEMLNLTLPDRGRLAQPNGNDDWSYTVDELMRVTAKRMFRHWATMGIARAPAGSSISFFMSDLGGVRHAQDAFAEEVMCGNVQPEILWVVGGDQFGGDGGGDAPRDTGNSKTG